MDRVRLGRALGAGAREAARAVGKAADAATSPDPGKQSGGASGQSDRPKTASGPGPVRWAEGHKKVPGKEQARTAASGIKRGSKRFGEAMWGPVVKVSGIVWLEVTGVLFSLFAIAAGAYLWQHRADFRAAGTPRQNLLLAAGMLILFGFFTVSNFLRARLRGRR